MNEILVTDTLFVAEDSVAAALMRDAGYTLDFLSNADALNPEILSKRLRGKVGYLLGGEEKVTAELLDAADSLRAISFTGSGWRDAITAWEEATRRGIKISATPGSNAEAVAEVALAGILWHTTRLSEMTLSRPKDSPPPAPRHAYGALTLGIVGLGHIGKALARRAIALGFASVRATAPTEPGTQPTGVAVADLDEVLNADVVSVHVSARRGQQVLGAREIDRLRNGSIVCNAAFPGAVDNNALLRRVAQRELSAFLDYPIDAPEAKASGRLVTTTRQFGFDEVEANLRTGGRAARSLVQILSAGNDPDVVNAFSE